MATAMEEQADGSAHPPEKRAGEAVVATAEPLAMPEKRAPAEREEGQEAEGKEEQRSERKRRRARVAALESVPRATEVAAAAAAAAVAESANREGESAAGGGCDGGGSFSFDHARSFFAAQTTPKFGSFNPAVVEFVAFHPRRRADVAATEKAEHGTVAYGEQEETAEGSDGNSR